MTERTLHIGCSGYPIDRAQYQRQLLFVELQDTRRALPKPDKFSVMKMSSPPGFTFALIAPEALCDPEMARDLPGGGAGYGGLRPTPENVALLERALAGARKLDAVVRLHTTSELGPGPDSFDRFRALLDSVDRSDVRIAWEQRGVLRDKELISWSERLGLIPVLDPFQDAVPPGPIGYIRIHPLMTLTGALHAEQFEKLLERATRYEEAYVVFDTPTAMRDALTLRRLAEGGPPPADGPDGPADDPDAAADEAVSEP